MRETELKLDIEPASHRRLMRATALAGVPARRRRILNIYYDTADGALRSRGLALRLRRVGRRWLQTLKARGDAAGGLHMRDEWEMARPGASIDVSLLRDTPLAALGAADSLQARLQPAFEVEFTRTTWELAPAPGCRLEVALDKGSVRAASRSEDISEVEIECLEGDAANAFDLAERLVEEVPMRPSSVSKAQRGYRLLQGGRRRAVKAMAPRLDARMPVEAAARAIVAAGLEQLRANEPGVGERDPEFVHQARVAMRRLRSALWMFRGAIGVELARAWRGELREAARRLGEARDWDVFCTESLPEAIAASGAPACARSLRARAAVRRRRARIAAAEALRSPSYSRVLLDVGRWLASEAAQPVEGAQTLPAYAGRVLRKLRKRVLAHAGELARMSPQERHRLRIEAKRLRYCSDSLASLLKPRAAALYFEALGRLQDVLGAANDAQAALLLLEEVPPPEPFAAFARGWFAARANVQVEVLEGMLAALAQSPPGWKNGRARSAAG